MKTKEIVFTHYWVTDFGWEPTIYHTSDFKEVEEAGKNDDGVIFYGRFTKSGKTHLLKGYYEEI
jgi:hypothetical protein